MTDSMPTSLPCGHDRSELRHREGWPGYCLQCDDERVVRRWVGVADSSDTSWDIISIARADLWAIRRELARLRAEKTDLLKVLNRYILEQERRNQPEELRHIDLFLPEAPKNA